jgi:hypothetical protein
LQSTVRIDVAQLREASLDRIADASVDILHALRKIK